MIKDDSMLKMNDEFMPGDFLLGSEFRMDEDEAFLLVEAYLYDRTPLLTSPEDVAAEVGISRDQAMEMLATFAKRFGEHCRWVVASTGQVFLKVSPSFLALFERSFRRNYAPPSFGSGHGYDSATMFPSGRHGNGNTLAPTPPCTCGHAKGSHDFDDGGHCKFCGCTGYHPSGGR